MAFAIGTVVAAIRYWSELAIGTEQPLSGALFTNNGGLRDSRRCPYNGLYLGLVVIFIDALAHRQEKLI